jgi:hypothetical protein
VYGGIGSQLREIGVEARLELVKQYLEFGSVVLSGVRKSQGSTMVAPWRAISRIASSITVSVAV